MDVTVTRGDDGWVVGGFSDIDATKEYVDEELEFYDPYECDYWEVEIDEGGSSLI